MMMMTVMVMTQSIRRNGQTTQNDQRENCKEHTTDLHVQISLLLSRLSSRRSDFGEAYPL